MRKFGEKPSLITFSYLNAIQNSEGPLNTPEHRIPILSGDQKK